MSFKTNTTINSKDITKRLKMTRIHRGYSSAKNFAKLNNICLSTYQLHETGRRTMSIEVLSKYALLLKVKLSWLISGEATIQNNLQHLTSLIEWADIIGYYTSNKLPTHEKIQTQVIMSEHSFATKVIDNSMAPLCPLGCIIFLDCSITIKSKDFALILPHNESHPIFRQLIFKEKNKYANALNPMFKNLRLSTKDLILGKVVQTNLVL